MRNTGSRAFRALVSAVIAAPLLVVFGLFALIGFSGLANAQMAVPALTGRIVDQTGTLTAPQKATLEQSLAAFEAKKGTQIAVLMVASTAPEAIEPFALRVAEQWKLGRKKVDDGAILVIAKDDRALRIEVGYGLEGALNDATSKRIIDEVIVPRLKQQDYFGGVSDGVDRMMRVVDGEPLPAPPAPAQRSAPGGGDVFQYAPILFVVALAAGGVLRAVLGRFPGALVTGGVVGVVAWFVAGAVSIALVAGVIALFVTLFGGGLGALGRLGGGYYGGGGGGRGGGGFGGGSGGGFSGGGGGFGGGGASGKW